MILDTSPTAWNNFFNRVKKAKAAGFVCTSPRFENFYGIHSVGKKSFKIELIEGGLPQTIGKTFFCNRLSEINTLGGNIGRTVFNDRSNVAQMSVMVELHPNLEWSHDKDKIIALEYADSSINYWPVEPVANDLFDEIVDDSQRITIVQRRLRQQQFKKNLMTAWNNRCCISGTAIIETLEAAHILPYSKGAENHSTNGLLLRADLHRLFDKGQLLIHPINLTVQLCPALRQTEYAKLHNQPIAGRKDKQSPNSEYLRARWLTRYWKETE